MYAAEKRPSRRDSFDKPAPAHARPAPGSAAPGSLAPAAAAGRHDFASAVLSRTSSPATANVSPGLASAAGGGGAVLQPMWNGEENAAPPAARGGGRGRGQGGGRGGGRGLVRGRGRGDRDRGGQGRGAGAMAAAAAPPRAALPPEATPPAPSLQASSLPASPRASTFSVEPVADLAPPPPSAAARMRSASPASPAQLDPASLRSSSSLRSPQAASGSEAAAAPAGPAVHPFAALLEEHADFARAQGDWRGPDAEAHAARWQEGRDLLAGKQPDPESRMAALHPQHRAAYVLQELAQARFNRRLQTGELRGPEARAASLAELYGQELERVFGEQGSLRIPGHPRQVAPKTIAAVVARRDAAESSSSAAAARRERRVFLGQNAARHPAEIEHRLAQVPADVAERRHGINEHTIGSLTGDDRDPVNCAECLPLAAAHGFAGAAAGPPDTAALTRSTDPDSEGRYVPLGACANCQHLYHLPGGGEAAAARQDERRQALEAVATERKERSAADKRKVQASRAAMSHDELLEQARMQANVGRDVIGLIADHLPGEQDLQGLSHGDRMEALVAAIHRHKHKAAKAAKAAAASEPSRKGGGKGGGKGGKKSSGGNAGRRKK